MFDWRELLLRNQNQPAQTDRTTLKLLEEQLLHLLPPVVNALNATNILPLQPTWSKNEIALKFNIILEEVEQRYLVAWDHVRNAQIQKLEADYQTWYQAQLRSDKSLFSTYCRWQELLIQQQSTVGSKSRVSTFRIIMMVISIRSWRKLQNQTSEKGSFSTKRGERF